MARKDYRSYISEAIDDTQKARFAAKRSEEGVRGAPTLGDVSRLYEIAGESCAEAGKVGGGSEFYATAWENYERAIKYAHDSKVQTRIRKKMNPIRHLVPSKRKKPLFKGRRLEKRLGFATLAIVALLGALFFSIFSLTGYAVGGLSEGSSRLIGVVLFVISSVLAFFYFRSKNRNVEGKTGDKGKITNNF